METVNIEDCSVLHPDTIKTMSWMKEKIVQLTQPGLPTPNQAGLVYPFMGIIAERVEPPNLAWCVPLQLSNQRYNFDVSINGQISVGPGARKTFKLKIADEASPSIELSDNALMVLSKLKTMRYFTAEAKNLSVSLGTVFAQERDIETGEFTAEKRAEFLLARWIISFSAVRRPLVEVDPVLIPDGVAVWPFVTPTDLVGTQAAFQVRSSMLNADLVLNPGSKVVVSYIPSCGGFQITSAEPRRFDLRDLSNIPLINTFENYGTV